MYFGINPLGLHFGMNQQPPPPQQPNQNGGFFAGFNNFIHNNFMNPLFPHAPRQQQQQRAESPKPTFSRRNGRVAPEERQEKKEEVKENSSLFWKMKGNEAFQRGLWQNAIVCYTKAIDADPTQSIYFSNRAQCLKKMKNVDHALRDAQEAVEIDPNNIRGHLICGQALAELGKQEDSVRKVENGITRLTKALTLNGGKKIELEK
jgi:STIP1 homology and U-box containing protein 1